MLDAEIVLKLIAFILPAYIANAAPVLIKARPKIPLDLKIKFFDRRRIFGERKTFAGAIVAILFGTLTGLVLAYLFPLFPTRGEQIISAFLLSIGAIVGDILGSFVKRRLSFAGGKPFIVDSLFFYIFAIAFAYPMRPAFLTLSGFFFLLILTMLLHPLSNFLAFKLKMKDVPW